MISSQCRHSARALRTRRTAIRFAFGAPHRRLDFDLSLTKTASKSRVNLLSRSRIEK